jgi:hypothetical protein|tara:strand:+ start:306 stop:518 length:213 start_codon:yes stop_codon:yes gene_type:complete
MEDDINKAIATLEKAVQFYINNNDDALECSSLYGSFTMVKLALEQFSLLGKLKTDAYGVPTGVEAKRNAV